jgi:hypothetical protein
LTFMMTSQKFIFKFQNLPFCSFEFCRIKSKLSRKL